MIAGSAQLPQSAASGLHVSCPIPLGIIKAIEVEAGLALPTDVGIHFERPVRDDGTVGKTAGPPTHEPEEG